MTPPTGRKLTQHVSVCRLDLIMAVRWLGWISTRMASLMSFWLLLQCTWAQEIRRLAEFTSTLSVGYGCAKTHHLLDSFPEKMDVSICASPSQEEVFVSNGTLKSEEKSQDARFGYALAAAPDLNHDGFTDLLVGAPLEDEHRGAIYVYHGHGIYITHMYKQVAVILRRQALRRLSVELICAFASASLIPTADSRLIDFALPAVLWPQRECSVGLGWR